MRLARDRYPFRLFTEYRRDGRGVLWRHDIDMSVHRALALARIEAEEGATTTYFVHLHSDFYNVFEREISDRLAEITGMGHHLGLHFDPAFYGEAMRDARRLGAAIAQERALLEHLLGRTLTACSFHNPDTGPWAESEPDELAGLVNAYGAYIRTEYTYCSDSNGYWRFDPLPQLLRESTSDRLHILTHPEWWVPQPLSPRQRVERCVNGRAAGALARYDRTLEASGRRNIR